MVNDSNPSGPSSSPVTEKRLLKFLLPLVAVVAGLAALVSVDFSYRTFHHAREAMAQARTVSDRILGSNGVT
jgi:hypothetical protein